MSLLQSIKYADEKEKNLIFGYIHDMEKTLEFDFVPPLIAHLIFLFYYVSEYFDRAPGSFKISEDKLTVTNVSNGGWSHTIYCHYPIQSISELVYEWIFKFEGVFKSYVCLGFAIISDEDCLNVDFCDIKDENKPCYAIYGPHGDKVRTGVVTETSNIKKILSRLF